MIPEIKKDTANGRAVKCQVAHVYTSYFAFCNLLLYLYLYSTRAQTFSTSTVLYPYTYHSLDSRFQRWTPSHACVKLANKCLHPTSHSQPRHHSHTLTP